VLDLGLLEAALAQPRMSFSGEELYPTIVEKAAALGHSLIQNHPFVDGNKRTGHAAMEVFLIPNGFEIDATVDEQEQVILAVAAGDLKRDVFTDWLRRHIVATN
jgi:death-on-curing protein